MERDRILRILREHESELKAAGLLHLRLFGSIARGEDTPASDVDLLADFNRDQPLTLMRGSGLQSQPEEILGKHTDLTAPDWLIPQIRSHTLQGSVVVF